MLDTAPDVAAFYSLIRYVADPLRDEPINIGMAMATPEGDWSRFSVQAPKTRLWAMGRRHDVEQIDRWAALVRDRYEVKGYRGLFDEVGRLSPALLKEWSRDFGASIRLSEPRIAVDSSLDRLWDDLFRTLVRGGARTFASQSQLLTAEQRQPRRVDERGVLIEEFLTAARRWPTFDSSLLHRDAHFEGLRASHLADLAIVNGHLTGIVQVLPMVHGTEADVITRRALLVEAAVDVDVSVAKLGVYDDPPPERKGLLEETQAVFEELSGGRRIQLVPRRRFDSLEKTLALVLFPELTGG